MNIHEVDGGVCRCARYNSAQCLKYAQKPLNVGLQPADRPRYTTITGRANRQAVGI